MAGSSVWLKGWAQHNGSGSGNTDIAYYIGIYFAFGIGSALLVVVQTLILWIFCSIEVRCHQVYDDPYQADASSFCPRRLENSTIGWQLRCSGHP